MWYEVKLTTQAIEQIQEIVRYISHILLVPETARKWADTLQSEIAKLDFMPTRYPLTEEEPWHTKGIHKMTFKNFLVYYLIDEKKEVVWVTAVVYGRRDQIIALVDMSLNVFKNLLSCEYNRGGWNCKFYGHGTIVSQLAIQYDIINNRKEGAYYGNKKCKCNGSCAAGD